MHARSSASGVARRASCPGSRVTPNTPARKLALLCANIELTEALIYLCIQAEPNGIVCMTALRKTLSFLLATIRIVH